MHSEQGPEPASTGTPQAAERMSNQTAALKSLARRRLIRGGLSVAPVVMSFASRPALGVTNADGCLSASATFSLAAGQHSNGVGILKGQPGCTGLGPAAWATTAFPAGYTLGSLFSDNFPGYTAGKTLGNILTVYNATSNPGGDVVAGDAQSQLRRNLVAAMLNIQAGNLSPSVVTLTTLITIWTGLKSGGPGTWLVRSPSTWNITQTNQWFGTLFTGAV